MSHLRPSSIECVSGRLHSQINIDCISWCNLAKFMTSRRIISCERFAVRCVDPFTVNKQLVGTHNKFVLCCLDLSSKWSLRVSKHNKLWIKFTTTYTQLRTQELTSKMRLTGASPDWEPFWISNLKKVCLLQLKRGVNRLNWCPAILTAVAKMYSEQDTNRNRATHSWLGTIQFNS